MYLSHMVFNKWLLSVFDEKYAANAAYEKLTNYSENSWTQSFWPPSGIMQMLYTTYVLQQMFSVVTTGMEN